MQPKPVLAGFAGRKALFDVEAYPNYILLTFHDVDTEITTKFRLDPDNDTDDRKAAEAYYRSLAVAIGYNSHGYDDHILDVVFKGVDCFDVWEHGDQIIGSGGRRRSPFLDRQGDAKAGFPLSLDLAALLTAKVGESKDGKPKFSFPSLKSLGNRFGYKHLQTLPIKPGTILIEEQKRAIDAYNVHDIAITRLVLGICSSRLNDRFAVQDGTNCPIRIGTPSCCGANDGSNASEQIGSPLGTESAGNFSVCGCGPQFPLAAIVIRWNFRMLQECKQVAAHLAVSFS